MASLRGFRPIWPSSVDMQAWAVDDSGLPAPILPIARGCTTCPHCGEIWIHMGAGQLRRLFVMELAAMSDESVEQAGGADRACAM
jgi:hypothetical protein